MDGLSHAILNALLKIQKSLNLQYICYLSSSIENMSTQTQEAPKVKMTLKERRMAREIKNFQESASQFLPQATFRRLVASTTKETVGEGIRFNGQSIKALQTAAEGEITTVFQGANILAHQAGRDTVTPLDIQTFQVLRNM